MVHRDQVERYRGTLEELAVDVGDLRYDALAAFLGSLAAKLRTDAEGDEGRRRLRLAAALRAAASGVETASAEVEKAWAISSRHM
jgi:hypothetical protein